MSELVRRAIGEQARPSIGSIATAGDLLQFAPEVCRRTGTDLRAAPKLGSPPPVRASLRRVDGLVGGRKLRRGRDAGCASGPTPWALASDASHSLNAPHGGQRAAAPDRNAYWLLVLGFYLHLEPGRVFAGAGTWHPEPPVLDRLRRAVATRGAEWKKATVGAFRRTCTLEGDALVRPPRGFPPDHPLIDDIKRKDLTALTRWTEEDALSPKFMARLTSFCRTATPFMKFLARALALEF